MKVMFEVNSDLPFEIQDVATAILLLTQDAEGVELDELASCLTHIHDLLLGAFDDWHTTLEEDERQATLRRLQKILRGLGRIGDQITLPAEGQ